MDKIPPKVRENPVAWKELTFRVPRIFPRFPRGVENGARGRRHKRQVDYDIYTLKKSNQERILAAAWICPDHCFEALMNYGTPRESLGWRSSICPFFFPEKLEKSEILLVDNIQLYTL